MNLHLLWFWIITGGLLAAAVCAVLRPLLKREAGSEPAQDNPSLAVYRTRFTELDDDIAGGSINATDKDAVRMELERDLLRADEHAHADVATPAGARHLAPAVALGLLLPALVIALYVYLGRPDLTDEDAMAEAGSRNAQLDTIEAMVDGLAAKLAQRPDDRQGWEMLARSYLVLGRYPEAAAAAEKLYALAGDEPDVLVRLADALSRANGGSLAGRPAELLIRALEIDPEHRSALWLAGAAAAEAGDHGAAASYWQRLIPLVESEPEIQAQVAEAITSVQRAGLDAGRTPQAANPGEIRIHVELAPALAAEVKPDMTVFIVAKASEGPAMPLAVLRRSVNELPLDVALDDSMAMSPAVKLSDFTTVDLSARISRSGHAERESGDLIGEITNAATGTDGLYSITIDKAVP